jgi:hypothetical protein
MGYQTQKAPSSQTTAGASGSETSNPAHETNPKDAAIEAALEQGSATPVLDKAGL